MVNDAGSIQSPAAEAPQPQKKGGSLGLMELYCLSIGQVIGAGIITLVGPAIGLTGLSAWLGYFLALVLGFFSIFPLVFITGTLRLSGGYYSLIAALTDKRIAGMYAFAQLTKMVSLSLFGVSLGVYVNSLWPAINPMLVGVLFLTFFYVLNLCGVDIMAQAQKYMTWILIAVLLMFVFSGFFNFNYNVFEVKNPQFMTDGLKGLFASMFLYVYSCTGYSMTMNYGMNAKNPQRDIPKAILLSVPTLTILYCGVAITAACSLPIEMVAGKPLTLVAQNNLSGPLFVVFMIGGPIMALMTTMNSSMPANCIPVMVSCEDGWLPKSFAAKNRRGAPWKILTVNYLLGLVPMLLGFNVNTITNNIMLLNAMLSFMYIYAYYFLPKKFGEAWNKSRWHIPNWLYYLVCTIALVAQIAIFYNSAKNLTPIVAGVSIGATVVCIVIGLIRSKDPNITARSSVSVD